MSTKIFQKILLYRTSLRKSLFVSVNLNKYYSKIESDFLKSPFPDVKIPSVSMTELLFDMFSPWHDKVAIECAISKRKYTYDDIRQKSYNLAKALTQKFKLKKGDVVAVLLPNVPEYVTIFFAGFTSGIILTTINPTYTPNEISKQISDSNVKAIFTLNSLFEYARKSIELVKNDIPIITIRTDASESIHDGSVDFHEIVNGKYEKQDFVFPIADDVALLPYSSGTTGLPKGVEITHKNLVSNLIPALPYNLYLPTTGTSQEVSPIILPIFHIYGLVVLTLLPLCTGSKLITLPKFTTELFTTVLQDYRPNVLFLVPPILNFMIESPTVKREHFESMRLIFSGAAPFRLTDEEKLFRKAENKDLDVTQGYGLTEASPLVCLNSMERKKKLNKSGTVGEPIPNIQVKIVAVGDETGKHCKPFENGELWAKGPQVMKGYYKKPEITAETIVNDGWLKTGDLAYYDSDNFIYLNDRIKELIKVKGFQVAPAELEELLRNHPHVADVAVIGVPHDKHGEVPRAYVVPSKKDEKIDAETLNAYLSKMVTDYKLLRGGVSVVDSIPKNTTGKILRRELKKLYENEK